MNDPIADMITRIKNVIMARHDEVVIPHSKMKEAIAVLLKDNGYIESFEVVKKAPQDDITVKLKYIGKTAAITDVRRVSKPGRRVYSPVKEIPKTLGGYGMTVVSTSKGVITDTQARKQNTGGEVLCQIW